MACNSAHIASGIQAQRGLMACPRLTTRRPVLAVAADGDAGYALILDHADGHFST
jgi:hypothetical protein